MTPHHGNIDLELRTLLAAKRVHADRDLGCRIHIQRTDLCAEPLFQPLAADEGVPLSEPRLLLVGVVELLELLVRGKYLHAQLQAVRGRSERFRRRILRVAEFLKPFAFTVKLGR